MSEEIVACICGSDKILLDEVLRHLDKEVRVICTQCDFEGPQGGSRDHAISYWNFMVDKKLKEMEKAPTFSSQALIDTTIERLEG